MNPQISESFRDLNVTLGEMTLPLEALCSGILVTGATGSGKTVSVVNPLSHALACVTDDESRMPSLFYFCVKGEAHQSFIASLPRSRQRDVIRIGSGEIGLTLFHRNCWPDQKALVEAVPLFIEEVSENVTDSVDANTHDPYWQRARVRVLNALSALKQDPAIVSLPPELAPLHSADHLRAMLLRLSMWMDHIESRRRENDEGSKNAGYFDWLSSWLRKQGLETDEKLETFRRWARDQAESSSHLASRHSHAMGILEKVAQGALEGKCKPKNETLLDRFSKTLDPSSRRKLEDLCYEYESLAQNTKSCVMTDLRGIVQTLTGGIAGKILQGKQSITLEEIMHHGKIAVLEASLTDSGGAARVINIALKLAIQSRILARHTATCHGEPISRKRPVVIVADEFHMLLSRGKNSGEDSFASRCREYGCIQLYASQNLSLMAGVLRDPRKLDALLANLSTKFFGRNSDHWTNQQASLACGVRNDEPRPLVHIYSDSLFLKRLAMAREMGELPRAKESEFRSLPTGVFLATLPENGFFRLDMRHRKLA